jgi:hypothetical protein
MVETITPVVHGRRRGPYWRSIALHALGAGVAAAAFGAALGGIGWLLRAPWGRAGLVAVGAVAVIYVLREALGLPLPLLDRKQQVPEWWRTFYSPPVAALLYGLGLGVGFATFLTYGTFVAVAAGAVASGSPATGALVCGPFGLARAAAVAVSSRAESSEAASDSVDRLEALAATPIPRSVNAFALVTVAAAALAATL